jgi:hypothetical protein
MYELMKAVRGRIDEEEEEEEEEIDTPKSKP